MESSYTGQLLLSIIFFAPGLVILAGLAFVGLLMAIEKIVSPKSLQATTASTLSGTASGHVVASLAESVASEGEASKGVVSELGRRS